MAIRTVFHDDQLVENLKRGDLHAFDKLYSQYSNKLFYFARGYLQSREDAEELVQEVFITIWGKRDILREDLCFDAYLYTITFNAIRKHFRSKSREKKHMERFSEEAPVIYDGLHSEIDYNNLRERADIAIDKLPQKRKFIYMLSREKGLSNEEIARKLGISKKTVENQIHLSLKFLREELG